MSCSSEGAGLGPFHTYMYLRYQGNVRIQYYGFLRRCLPPS